MKQCCGNCSAWHKNGEDTGDCRAVPPTPILIGMQQVPVPGKAIMMPGNGQNMTTLPIVHSFFPSMKAFGWCRCWQASPESAVGEEICVVPEGGLIATDAA